MTAATGANTRTVHTARLVHHDEQQWTDLLLDTGVRCAKAVLALGCEFALYREWQHGPHLRFAIRGPAEAAGRARDVLDEVLGAVVRERPSRRTLSFDQVREKADLLAAREGVEASTQWWADNTVRWESTEQSLVPDSVAGLVDELAFRASAPGLRLLAAARRGELSIACCDLLAATAGAFSANGLSAAAMSFRSHAEAYLALDAPAGSRANWEAQSAQVAESLGRRLHDVADNVIRPTHVQEWLAAITPVVDRGVELMAEGRVVLPTTAGAFSPELTERSSFHRDLVTDPDWPDRLIEPGFLRFRLALNLTYLQLTRLGVTPATRYRLCHLVCTSVDGADRPTREATQ